jgi:[ribosomal protein S5]-alanine N-acetyltransferase
MREARRGVLLETDRIRLRRPRLRDGEEFLEMVRSSRRIHRPWVHPPEDMEGYSALLRRCRSPRSEGIFAWSREDDALVGVFLLSEIVRGGFQSAYLGYYGHTRHAGKGLMSEALELVVQHAFREMGLHRVEANIQPGNIRSIALVKRCGFRREGYSPRYLKIGGRWRDHERWTRLRDDSRRGDPETR